MTIMEWAQQVLIVNQLLRIAFIISLVLLTIGAGLVLFRHLVLLIRRSFIDGIEVYSRLQAARLDVVERQARLGASKESARQALAERRRQLRAGYVPQSLERRAAQLPVVASVPLDKNQLQPALDLEPANTTELWQDYTRLRMEYRRLQLLVAIDREVNGEKAK